MMKRVFNFLLCLMSCLILYAQMPKLTVQQHLEDYDFAVKYLEDNYAGFPNKVVDSTRADYESMRDRLRTEVSKGKRTCWDAVAAYTAWFDDFHTRLCLNYGDSSDGLNKQYNEKYWSRKKIHYEKLMEVYRPQPVACKVTDKTFLVRFPSCYGTPGMEWIKGSIGDFKASGCENLIIDIRDNGGGSDIYFKPYWELLYDHPGTQPAVEFRNTPEHRKLLLESFREGGMPEPMVTAIQSVLPMISQIPYVPLGVVNQFLLGNGQDLSIKDLAGILGTLGSSSDAFTTMTFSRDSMDTSVRKAALIIDNGIASSGEQMVRQIRLTSNRTTIYGRDNTMGCLDFSNLNEIEMPNSHINFTCPMSRTIGLPENGIDQTGFAPDVRIPLPLPARLTDNIDEWVTWVAAQLEK